MTYNIGLIFELGVTAHSVFHSQYKHPGNALFTVDKGMLGQKTQVGKLAKNLQHRYNVRFQSD